MKLKVIEVEGSVEEIEAHFAEWLAEEKKRVKKDYLDDARLELERLDYQLSKLGRKTVRTLCVVYRLVSEGVRIASILSKLPDWEDIPAELK